MKPLLSGIVGRRPRSGPLLSGNAIPALNAVDTAAATPALNTEAFTSITDGATAAKASAQTIATALSGATLAAGGVKQQNAEAATIASTQKTGLLAAAQAISSEIATAAMSVLIAAIVTASGVITGYLDTIASQLGTGAVSGSAQQRAAALVTALANFIGAKSLAAWDPDPAGAVDGRLYRYTPTGVVFRYNATISRLVRCGYMDGLTPTLLASIVGTEASDANMVSSGWTVDKGGGTAAISSDGTTTTIVSGSNGHWYLVSVGSGSWTSTTKAWGQGYMRNLSVGATYLSEFGGLEDGTKDGSIKRYGAGATTYVALMGAIATAGARWQDLTFSTETWVEWFETSTGLVVFANLEASPFLAFGRSSLGGSASKQIRMGAQHTSTVTFRSVKTGTMA